MSYQEFDDIELGERNGIVFDFKGYLFKALHYWKLIFLCIGVAFLVAYLINLRKQSIYRLHSLISIESEQNPFFTANTSISFNWGGTSGKVGLILTTFKTRTHNEKVVDSLQYYLDYLVQGKYHMIDIYKGAPFYLELDKSKGQILNKPIGIRFLDDTQYEIFTEFEDERGYAQRYDHSKTKSQVPLPLGTFNKKYKIGEPVALPFLNFTLHKRNTYPIKPLSEYFVKFYNFDNVVQNYSKGISVSPDGRSAGILRLSLAGTNKAKIVDYLNTTTTILSISELERKNLYATNTIKFIDSSLAAVSSNLKGIVDEMSTFRKENKVFDVGTEMSLVSSKLQGFELEREGEQIKLNYLEALETYLNTKTNYVSIAAPTSVGISEGNILTSVRKITTLAIERQNLEYTTREESELFKDLDRKIDAEKNVLLETIDATKRIINSRIKTLNGNIASLEIKLNSLPEDQQQFLKIQRKMNISQEAYDVYLAKRSEAAIVKAANVSDIIPIDEAKDIGGGFIGPNKSLNYWMALMVGFFSPMLLIFIIYLLDNTIHGSDEVERISNIPILGLLGKYRYHNNLVVFEKPKAAISESFRSIRSSLQYIYKKQDIIGGKTILVTSSVSGEGKTFCSINIATAYALSGKKTILLGLDLRKPKIFNDFDINNEKGIVNCLIEDEAIESVIHHTHIENLDIIPSGPVPPNPSELLMRDNLKTLIADLRKIYDIIVLDTPPIGLVTDAMELTQYADATLFMVRLDYTKKGMLQLINSKYKKGEIKNISFILNFYKHKTNNNYGYGYGYGYGYSYGYGNYGNTYHDNNKPDTFLSKLKRLLKRL